MTHDREDIEFTSQGATLRGWLYRAAAAEASPAVVMAHGFSAVREMFLDRYAEAFVAAGFTTLVYDHFGFGASDGEPRQCPAPSLQLQGYRDAIDWLGRDPQVDADRIGIWGSSFSGGEVIILAAEELPIRCAVAQVPVMGGAPTSPATAEAIGSALAAGRLDATIPVASATADGVGLMYRDDAYAWFTRVSAERAPSWRNEVKVQAFAEPFLPLESLDGARVPLLLLVADNETLLPTGAGIAVAETVPMIELVRIPGGHFDAYEAGFDVTSSQAVEWFSEHLSA